MEIPSLFADRELLIQRFTLSASKLFNLLPTDIGSALNILAPRLEYLALPDDVARARDEFCPVHRDVQIGDRWYLTRIIPDRNLDGEFSGVIIISLDTTDQKESEVALRASEERAAFVRESSGVGF